MLKHELERYDDQTFFFIKEINDTEGVLTSITIATLNNHPEIRVFKTIYGAFMARANLGVDKVNKSKKYAIYYCHPSSKDIIVPYHFENESAWYTGEVVIRGNIILHYICTGILEYEKSVFSYEDGTDFAYLTFTAINDKKDDNAINIRKQIDFDYNSLVKGHFSHFWFIKNVGTKEGD